MSIPTRQKAFRLQAKFGTFAVDTIEVKKPGPDDILYKVEAAALNPGDWKIAAFGLWVEQFPAVFGYDAAGIVVQVGENVENISVGDRVATHGHIDLATGTYNGTYCQYCVHPARSAAKIPASLSFEDASTVMSGVATAAFPLYTESKEAASAHLLPPWQEGGRGKYAGKPFLVFGGSSAVGQFAIQFARLSGFSPIIATASASNTEYVKSRGATHVVDRKLSADALKAEVKKITSAPIEVVYDAVSTADTLQVAYDLTAPKGNLVVVMPGDAIAKDESAGKNIIMAVGGFSGPTGDSLIAAMPQLLESGDIKPHRVEVLPGGLDAISGGMQRLKENAVSAVKLVVKPQETAGAQ